MSVLGNQQHATAQPLTNLNAETLHAHNQDIGRSHTLHGYNHREYTGGVSHIRTHLRAQGRIYEQDYEPNNAFPIKHHSQLARVQALVDRRLIDIHRG